ncbi:MAG: GNAT family N-acetyltransferase [Chloroflexi bacterium]|nr:GNAT family N-acetyltransferase [Chloroflexota bacterium]
MKKIIIRPAVVADAPAISAVHCSTVERWLAQDADGVERPARYNDLTPFQRWLNGGPWMDAETCAGHLKRLVAAGGYPFVAELNGRILAEAELTLADEPAPFGRNLNLAVLYVHRNHQGQGLGSLLMQKAFELADEQNCETFTIAHAEAPDFYFKRGLRQAAIYTRFRLSTQTANLNYTAEPLPDVPYDLVRGWGLALGRYQNAAHDWERTRPDSTPDFPEWRGLRLERYWLTLDGQRSALILEESPRFPGLADVFLFTRSPLTPGLLAAIRDRAARSGLTHLHCFAPSDFKHPDATALDYVHRLFLKRLHS